MSINNTVVSGHLCADAEQVEGHSKTFAKCRLAINQGKDKPSIFFDLAAWSRWCIEDLLKGKKGDRAIVSGRLTLREWEARDGTTRTQLGISCESVEIYPKQAAAGPPDSDGDEDGDEIPW